MGFTAWRRTIHGQSFSICRCCWFPQSSACLNWPHLPFCKRCSAGVSSNINISASLPTTSWLSHVWDGIEWRKWKTRRKTSSSNDPSPTTGYEKKMHNSMLIPSQSFSVFHCHDIKCLVGLCSRVPPSLSMEPHQPSPSQMASTQSIAKSTWTPSWWVFSFEMIMPPVGLLPRFPTVFFPLWKNSWKFMRRGDSCKLFIFY